MGFKWVRSCAGRSLAYEVVDQGDDEGGSLETGDGEHQVEDDDVAATDALPEHPAVVVVLPDTPVTQGAVATAPPPVQLASCAEDPLLFVVVLLVLEERPRVDVAQQGMEYGLGPEGILNKSDVEGVERGEA